MGVVVHQADDGCCGLSYGADYVGISLVGNGGRCMPEHRRHLVDRHILI